LKPNISESVNRGTDDLRKSIRDKDLEIEKLNAECLELEDKCASLTKEAKEAWESYRISQERAAAREAELLDEVKDIQKAKAAEKQQIVGQISKSQNEMETLIKQINTLQDEKNGILEKLDEMEANEELWRKEKTSLEEDLFQARSGSVQGVQSLRDELSQALSTADQLRSDYATLTKLSQIRQQELEQQNQELERSLTEKDREIAKVNMKIQQYDKNNPNTKEIDELNRKIESFALALEEEKEKTVSLEKKLKQHELTHKAAQIAWDDNRTNFEKVIHDLKLQLKQESQGSVTTVLDTDADKIIRMQEELDNYVAQVQTLTRQLLNKQGAVLELQAERAALKSRVADLQTRNAKN
jgi:chromosome segregation ATPase